MGLDSDQPRVLVDTVVPRTLPRLVDHILAVAAPGDKADIWVFEDAAARRAAAARLAAAGISARVLSAYKPVVHALLEEVDGAGAARLLVRYPEPAGAVPGRFLAEAYPAAVLAGAADTRFEPAGEGLDHEIVVERQDGGRVRHRVFAPNRAADGPHGTGDLRPCGWLRLTRAGAAVPFVDEPVETEFERLFDLAVATVRHAEWPGREPFVARLVIAVATGGIERPLPVLGELMSTREALHEDLYFTVLDLFHQRAGRPAQDRRARPGQVVPLVSATEGDSRLVIRVEPLRPLPADDDDGARPEDGDALARIRAAMHPLSLPSVARALDGLGGEARDGRSVEGRRVLARRFAGAPPHVLLSAGCHGNEPSGVAGALIAAAELKARGVGFTLIPVQNPDGYALHRRLMALAPDHMHHAARYTALGDDLAHRNAEPLFETAVLRAAQGEAALQIDLHGYPAHEWTRPFSGYLPRGFEAWSIPRGFFLLVDHRPGDEARAKAFADRMTAALAREDGLLAFNAARLDARRPHAGEADFELLNGLPVKRRALPHLPTPLQVITEFPDETLHGAAFRFAHRIQASAALAAVDALLAAEV